ncbi:MAG: DUF6075 family protein [Lachnospiraceae bacterium]
MNINTALGAQNDTVTKTIIFKDEEHKKFYFEYLQRCRCDDVYHKVLIYTLGIDRDSRENIDTVYDFNNGCVKPEGLHQGWITSGSARIVRMAFNLYCNGTPTVFEYEDDPDAALDEAKRYSAEELFCCGYALFFWQAIQIRYPEYCQEEIQC